MIMNKNDSQKLITLQVVDFDMHISNELICEIKNSKSVTEATKKLEFFHNLIHKKNDKN